jgi:hypothetical protein
VLSFHDTRRDTADSAHADWLPLNLAFTASLYGRAPTYVDVKETMTR